MLKCARDIHGVEYDVTDRVRQRKKLQTTRFKREMIISLVLWIVTRLVFPISFKQQRLYFVPAGIP